MRPKWGYSDAMPHTPAIAEPCVPALTGSGVPRLAAANALLTPAVEGVNEWEPTVLFMGRDGRFSCHAGADHRVWQPELAGEAGAARVQLFSQPEFS